MKEEENTKQKKNKAGMVYMNRRIKLYRLPRWTDGPISCLSIFLLFSVVGFSNN